MSVEKIRKEFEIEFDSYLLQDGWNQASLGMMKERDSEGEYTAARTQGAWWAWQASRAAVVVELPDGGTSEEYAYGTPVVARGVALHAIQAEGLKVKP